MGGDAPPIIVDFFTRFYPEDLLLCFLMLLLDLLFRFAAANGALLSSSGTPLTLDQPVCLVTLQFSLVAAVAGGGSSCIVQLSPPANTRGILHVCVRSAADQLTVRRWFVTLSWRFEALSRIHWFTGVKSQSSSLRLSVTNSTLWWRSPANNTWTNFDHDELGWTLVASVWITLELKLHPHAWPLSKAARIFFGYHRVKLDTPARDSHSISSSHTCTRTHAHAELNTRWQLRAVKTRQRKQRGKLTSNSDWP